MTTEAITLTDVQYTAARALAHGHGHGWAHEVPAAHPIPGCLWTAELIRELYAAVARRDRWEPWQWGISSPTISPASGNVVHTTMTGRCSWQVAPDGTVGIVISRPGEEYLDDSGPQIRSRVVLSARVRPDRTVEIRDADHRDGSIPNVWDAMWSPADGPRAEARHGDALVDALATLMPWQAARDAVSAVTAITPASDDPLLGFSPSEIIVGPGGQTLTQAAEAEGR